MTVRVLAGRIDPAVDGVQTGGMRVELESVFPCSAERVWSAVQETSLLGEVSRPLVTFSAVCGESLPERWTEGLAVRVRSYLFGCIPLGTRTLEVEQVDYERRVIQTRERDPLIRRWDHRISVAPLSGESCLYADEVEIDAGMLTVGVWLFAQWFFRHRHRRWKRVAERLRATPFGVPRSPERELAHKRG